MAKLKNQKNSDELKKITDTLNKRLCCAAHKGNLEKIFQSIWKS